MPRKLTDGVAIGEVTGDYVFSAEDPYKHSRPVSWSEESVPRDTFKQDLRHSLGAFMTVCEVKRNAALDRVRADLETGAGPGSLLGSHYDANILSVIRQLRYSKRSENAIDVALFVNGLLSLPFIRPA